MLSGETYKQPGGHSISQELFRSGYLSSSADIPDSVFCLQVFLHRVFICVQDCSLHGDPGGKYHASTGRSSDLNSKREHCSLSDSALEKAGKVSSQAVETAQWVRALAT